jgi:hypothetical protein
LMEKESSWSRYTRMFFARPGILVPFSAAAVALFVLFLNFQENAPLQTQYYDAASLMQAVPEPAFAELALELPDIEVVTTRSDFDQASEIASSASFVMDLIPNEEPESLSYIREFPTSTIPAENRVVSALVSYTIAHDLPTFGVAGRTQTFGF